MPIQDLVTDPRFDKLNAKQKQTVIGAYFDDIAPQDERFKALDDKQKSKIREAFIRDHAPAGAVATAGAAAKQLGQRAKQSSLNTLSSVFELFGMLNPRDEKMILPGLSRPTTGATARSMAQSAAQSASEAGQAAESARLETGTLGDVVQGGAGIAGSVAGSLPAFSIVPPPARALSMAPKLAQGALKFGLGSALSAPPEDRLRAAIGGAVTGPISARAGDISRLGPLGAQLAPRTAVGAVEGIGNVAEQAAFTGQVDPREALVQAGIGFATGRNRPEPISPSPLGLPSPTDFPDRQISQQLQITADAGKEVDFNVGGDPDVLKATKTLNRVQKKAASGKLTEKDVEAFRSANQTIKQKTAETRAVIRSGFEEIESPDAPPIMENKVFDTIKAQEESMAALEGNRGRDPVTPEGVDPNAQRAQIRLDETDVNPNVIEQPNIPGGFDERMYGGAAAINPGIDSIYRTAKGTYKWIQDRDAVITSMIDRIRLMDSEPATRIADMLEKKASASQEIAGKMSGELNAVMDHLKGGRRVIGFAQGAEDLRGNLTKFTDIDMGGGVLVRTSNMRLAIEDKLPRAVKDSLTDRERKTVDLLRNLISKRGEIAEVEGTLVMRNGEIQQFRNLPDQKVAPRVATDELLGILQLAEKEPLRQAYTRALATMNGMEIGEVEGRLRNLSKTLSGEEPDSMLASVQFDFERSFENVPDMMVHDGVEYRLQEVNPAAYANALVRSGSEVMGFRRVFGQELDKGNRIADLKREFTEAHPGQAARFTEAVRIANGMPLESGKTNLMAARRSLRGVNGVLSVMKALNLSATAVINIPETAATAANFHSRAYFKAIKDLALNPQVSTAEVEAMGLHFRDIFSPTIDPTRPFHSSASILSEAINRFTSVKQANDVNSIIIGRTALNAANMWRKGKFTERDIDKLVGIGFSRPLAKRIASGKASSEVYDDVARRIARKLPGGVISNLEKSKIENQQWFRQVSAFHTYANQTLRMNQRALRETAERWDRIQAETAPGSKERAAAIASMGVNAMRGIGLRAGTGAAAAYLTAVATDGMEGEEQFRRRFADNYTLAFLENLKYQTLVGPYGRASASLFGDNTDQFFKSIYAVGQLMEFKDFMTGDGAYQDGFTYPERAAEYLTRMTPGHKILANIGSMAALNNSDQKMEADIRAYYNWKRDNDFGRQGGGNFESTRLSSRVRRAIEKMGRDGNIIEAREEFIRAIIDEDAAEPHFKTLLEQLAQSTGNMEKAKEELALAFIENPKRFLSGRDPISQSIKSRKLLTKSKIQPTEPMTDGEYELALVDLRKRIGEEAYARLEARDRIVDILGETWMYLSKDKIMQMGGTQAIREEVPREVERLQDAANSR